MLRTHNMELSSQAEFGVTSILESKPQVPLTFWGKHDKLGKWTGPRVSDVCPHRQLAYGEA